MVHSHGTDAAKWNELAEHFEQLADKEQGAGSPPLRATIRDPSRLRDVADWFFQDARWDRLRETFSVRATEATRAFGTLPDHAELLSLWLHRVHQFLCTSQSPLRRDSQHLANDGSSERIAHPGIEKVCDASAAFCRFLQRQANENESDHKQLSEHFQEWIVDNSSPAEPFYWSSPDSVRSWVSIVARIAQTTVPIDFLSARLNVFRLPLLLKECESLRAFFKQIAKQEDLVWCVTKHGLWMAQQLPTTGEYIDAEGRQHDNADLELAKQSEQTPKPNQSGVPTQLPSQSGPAEAPAPDRNIHATPDRRFSASSDYCSVRFDGTEYTLTPSQSRMLKVLWEAWESGHPAVHKDRLASAGRDSETSEVRNTWRRCALWQTLIVSRKKGVYQLDLSHK
jgi:hypothetical protein